MEFSAANVKIHWITGSYPSACVRTSACEPPVMRRPPRINRASNLPPERHLRRGPRAAVVVGCVDEDCIGLPVGGGRLTKQDPEG